MNTTYHKLRHLRLAGKAEGISLLVLLFFAMPLKYIMHIPQAVQMVGWAHGLLFIIFMTMVGIAWLQKNLTFQNAVLAFVAAFLPFGTFWFDWHLKRAVG